LNLGTVLIGLGWSRIISGHFWKSLGLANFFFGLGDTCLGIGLYYGVSARPVSGPFVIVKWFYL